MHEVCPEPGAAPDADIALPSDVVYPRDPTSVTVGVGPAPKPWPDDPRLDPDLLAGGDRRNVLDRYRYWSVAAIVADLDGRRHPLHIAIQNWEHDFNIGSIVRTGNAFNVAGVHILGRHRWNRRGALVTDRYLEVHHHPDVASFAQYCRREQLVVVGVDNLPGSVPLEAVTLSRRCCLVFGSEGEGLTDELAGACSQIVSITQYGSTRSMNAGAAAAIAMYHWALSHACGPADGGVNSPANVAGSGVSPLAGGAERGLDPSSDAPVGTGDAPDSSLG